MKQVSTRHQLIKTLLLSLVLLLFFSTFSNAQEQVDPAKVGQEAAPQIADAGALASGDSAVGKELFNTLCASCHKRYKDATGPALHGVTERHSKEWLYKWIKNNSELRGSKAVT